MSRSLVIDTIKHLKQLDAEEHGVEGGFVGGGPVGGRRRFGMGGVQVPFFGGELYQTPAAFGYGAGCNMMGYGGYPYVGGKRSKASMNCAEGYYRCMVPVRQAQAQRRLANPRPPRTLSVAQKNALYAGLDVFEDWLARTGARRGNFNPLSQHYNPNVVAAWKIFKQRSGGPPSRAAPAAPFDFE